MKLSCLYIINNKSRVKGVMNREDGEEGSAGDSIGETRFGWSYNEDNYDEVSRSF